MSRLLIERVHDEWGTIEVSEDKAYRYLSFGTDTEQSCMLKAQPTLAQYDYIRAMLLPLLYEPAPKRVLVLGLGAGTLVSCLHHYSRQIKITAVELRPAVIELASRYFQLPASKKITLVADDAFAYLRDSQSRDAQLILVDLYDGHDVCQTQLEAEFIDLCLQRLSGDGWIVFNCWASHQRNHAWIAAVKEALPTLLETQTQDGNWIIMGCRKAPSVGQAQLRERAKNWQKVMPFSLPLAQLKEFRH